MLICAISEEFFKPQVNLSFFKRGGQPEFLRGGQLQFLRGGQPRFLHPNRAANGVVPGPTSVSVFTRGRIAFPGQHGVGFAGPAGPLPIGTGTKPGLARRSRGPGRNWISVT